MKKMLLALTLVVGAGSLMATSSVPKGFWESTKGYAGASWTGIKNHKAQTAIVVTDALVAGDLIVECAIDKSGEKWALVKGLFAAMANPFKAENRAFISSEWNKGNGRFVVEVAAVYGLTLSEVGILVYNGLASVEWNEHYEEFKAWWAKKGEAPKAPTN